MSLDLTVAIPTYNGASRLPQVLERLQNQNYPQHLQWEIIIIDNNSKDNTAKLIQEYQKTWDYPFSLKYFLETRQGAAFARIKAIQEAQGELVCFLDDDNLPALDWLLEADKFAQEHPQAGAIASQIHGIYDRELPAKLKPIMFYLAINERGEQPHLYHPRRQGFPPSAGLVVRCHVWKNHVPFQPFFTGRVGSSMLGSEDAEALCYIQKAGWEIWYNPAMQIEHIIPASRLEKDYLISLMRGVGLASSYLRMLILKKWQRPLAFLVYLVNDIRKVIAYFILHWTQIHSDIRTACELERMKATVISPFFLAKIQIQRFLQDNTR
ncbi:MAG TPA: hormogonium polysaccharide biosynthesis glycosyltransferase HpsE [Nostocaceae cyanobacterium]|nr:hormogonium polysaccharide biosynthesis glycosyltransferase HpsE [Nostocaceae cyanobacterium]